jgi:hypothetical protein
MHGLVELNLPWVASHNLRINTFNNVLGIRIGMNANCSDRLGGRENAHDRLQVEML